MSKNQSRERVYRSRFLMRLAQKAHPHNYISASRTNHTAPQNLLWITCGQKRVPKGQLGSVPPFTTSVATIYSLPMGVNGADGSSIGIFLWSYALDPKRPRGVTSWIPSRVADKTVLGNEKHYRARVYMLHRLDPVFFIRPSATRPFSSRCIIFSLYSGR